MQVVYYEMGLETLAKEKEERPLIAEGFSTER